jgi:hypothetical protein
MPSPRSRQGPTVTRQILFYKVNVGLSESGEYLPFDVDILKEISSLSFSDTGGRYVRERNGDQLCAWLHSNGDPYYVRFGKIRRGDFPQVEHLGTLEDLSLAEGRGLVDAIHMVFFPNNILAADSASHAPRLTRFAHYLQIALPQSFQQISFDPLIRPDISAALRRLKDIRFMSIRVKSSKIEALGNSNSSLRATFASASQMIAADRIELVLRIEKDQREGAKGPIMDIVNSLVNRDDLHDIASHFEVKGEDEDTGRVTALDLLSSQLLTERSISKQTARGRAVDPDSAFAQITDAYQKKLDDINRASSVIP